MFYDLAMGLHISCRCWSRPAQSETASSSFVGSLEGLASEAGMAVRHDVAGLTQRRD